MRDYNESIKIGFPKTQPYFAVALLIFLSIRFANKIQPVDNLYSKQVYTCAIGHVGGSIKVHSV